MKCKTIQNTQAQDALNTIFNKVLKKHEGETLEQIKNIQTEWLAYRNQECTLEADQVEEESLRRIQELRCLTRVTEERIVALDSFDLIEPEEKAGEISAQPRWMNALAVDEPDVFWRYGDVIEADLDCDEEPEFMLVGLKVDSKTGDSQSVVSVSENPMTGRPLSTVLGVADCSAAPKLSIKDAPVEVKPKDGDIEVEGEETLSSCAARAVVTLTDCPEKTVLWNGSAYVFED